MEECFLDTNVIVRHITDDVPAMAATARALLKRVETGEVSAHITEAVLIEAIQVLTSPHLYNLDRATVARDLAVILELRGLRLPTKEMYFEALDLWAASRLDFPDVLAVAYMRRQGLESIATFDRDFDRFPGISRLAEFR